MSETLARLQAELGVTRHSDWLTVDQAMIDRFSDVTMDRQYIHVDPIRARETRFGGTIAHGFLILSLLAHLEQKIAEARCPDVQMGVNYGFDRIRFVAPVRAGSRIRAASTLASVREKSPGQFEQSLDIRVEVEGEEKPAIVARWITQYFI
ncbi:MaoC family dehydratase [Sphingobium chungbukense]|uniref:Nodulation protein NodN n=1 Tax=Sphingobium chungbukense TaxID=56193 RepID=A0A0M3AN09_9SPHN|nr:MaoC family dehydratase [Sphingobium chungbukense]KKW91552.1 nodulation protein NodN [Sphingobium chungbukense]